jgi:hypothetical protein
VDSDLRAIGADGKPLDMQDVIDHLRRLPFLSSVIRYMIFNRKIYQAPDFTPQTYTGPSPHTEHAHFSGARTQASDENTTFDFKLKELIEMPLTDAEIDKIADRAAAKVWAFMLTVPRTDAPDDRKAAGDYQAWTPSFGQVDAVGAKIDALAGNLMTQLDQKFSTGGQDQRSSQGLINSRKTPVQYRCLTIRTGLESLSSELLSGPYRTENFMYEHATGWATHPARPANRLPRPGVFPAGFGHDRVAGVRGEAGGLQLDHDGHRGGSDPGTGGDGSDRAHPYRWAVIGTSLAIATGTVVTTIVQHL